MTIPLAFALATALAAAPASGPTPAQLLVGQPGWGGSLGGNWKGWENTQQMLLDERHVRQVFRSGSRYLVTVERQDPTAGAKGPRTVVAAIEFPVPKGYVLSEPGYCEVKGEVTPLAFAVVADAGEHDEYHPSAQAAWVVDLAATRIVALDPKTVRCGHAGYGL